MAVQAQFGGLAGVNPAYEGRAVEAQMLAMQQDYGYRALLSPACAAAYYDGGYNCNDCAAGVVVSGAQSGLTCHNGPSRKRSWDADAYSSASLLPIPGMSKASPSPPDVADEFGVTTVEPAMASTSGRSASWSAAAGALASRHEAEIDALMRADCERLRAGLDHAWKRQCQALVHAAARRMSEKDAELDAARRRNAALEERLGQVTAESEAWRGLARSNEAVAAGLRATLDHVLLLRAAAPAPAEGFGESALDAAAADDAQSCCFEGASRDAPNDDDVGLSSPSAALGKWACKCCGEREASVLLLPCRHLCLCKVCEPRLDACPSASPSRTPASRPVRHWKFPSGM